MRMITLFFTYQLAAELKDLHGTSIYIYFLTFKR